MSFQDLATMIAYFKEQQGKIQQLLVEIEEINTGVTSELVEAQDQMETAIASAVGVADDEYEELAPWIRDPIDAAMPVMREKKAARRAELEQSISDLYQQRAEIESSEAEQLAELADVNPELNAREEELKQQLVEAEAAVAATEQELRAAGAGLGWLAHAGRLRALRKQHQQQATALYGVRERLHEVRSTWSRKRTEAEEAEERRRGAWRLRTADIARLTQELDNLSTDFESACRRAALAELIRGTREYQPSGSVALDQELAGVAEWRQRHEDCESGVVAVSEIMGLLTGIKEGLARMQSSVEGVKQEQDMHSELSTLHFQAPPEFLQFHQLWDALLPTVVNEKQSIEHPKAFADIIRQVISEQLSDEKIEAMFHLAGSVLTEATKQWD